MFRATQRYLGLHVSRHAKMAAQSTPPRNPVVAIIGTTGTGKSQLAVDTARGITAKYGRVAEIINADAMQMYAGLPIITNKITVAEQMGVKHHLLGCIDVEEEPWRVGEFVKEAKSVIASIHDRGGVPILVGGTHYYLQNLLFDRGLVSRVDASSGEAVEQQKAEGETIIECPELDEMDTAQLYARLQEVDPVMAARWHPNDRRKIRRSLEIWLQTGKKASTIYAEQQEQEKLLGGKEGDEYEEPTGRLKYPTLIFWTHTERDTLVDRLNKRVDKMLATGLLDEVSQLNQLLHSMEAESGKTVDLTRGIWVSIGFKQFKPYLDSLRDGLVGETTLKQILAAGLDETKGATRQYAKSQLKWIRIKLLLALRDAGATSVMWPLSTDLAETPGHWATDVAEPAGRLTSIFLKGEHFPSQEAELVPALLELLEPKRDYDLGKRRDLWVTRTCDVCNVTATTEIDWEKHVQGNRHHKLVKKRRQREERARSLPSRQRHEQTHEGEESLEIAISEDEAFHEAKPT